MSVDQGRELTVQETVVRYERLRDRELHGGRSSRERELFVRCGMIGWLNAWARCAPLPNAAPANVVKSQPEMAAMGLAVPLGCVVAEVLAAMTWTVLS